MILAAISNKNYQMAHSITTLLPLYALELNYPAAGTWVLFLSILLERLVYTTHPGRSSGIMHMKQGDCLRYRHGCSLPRHGA